MKKLLKLAIILLSALTIVFSFAGCNKNGTDNSNGIVYSLKEAYDLGLISEDDVRVVSYLYHERRSEQGLENPYADLTPKPTEPAPLSAEKYKEIEDIYRKQYFENYTGDIPHNEMVFRASSYYGIFNGVYILDINISYLTVKVDPIFIDEYYIGEILFRNFHPSIMVYCEK